ncbi:MAG: malto-oligosyltrehalose trehalohydrolase [Drouetiella hepatica Uher 2000/2452]|jgi:maltooligosyltrehalose trehalohydrolase|uniref:Malto-oligosyltrehalose trehalohydrolase n=1 Tax=Drouetiella hepatica Uher 2000/2452 TaxID=904376 RepID=A0A951QGG8_9CYAN|nr:malto-oligosyltrehalose trehalohydrolase [Drouetiella hepatica Uher 2000/2452]
MQVGSWYHGNGRCTFTVWAPLLEQVSVHIVAPKERFIALDRKSQGYWQTTLEDVEPGTLYFYQLNGEIDRPDPASQAQPEGVHGASAVVDHSFEWTDASWQNLPFAEMAIYELHVGTFTPEGTFEAAIARLPDLKELGVTTIELMPIAQFPGSRNWGYDGVYPYGVQMSYGGVQGLKRLVNACHEQGMAMFLDVVYNHFGPEGNYIWSFGPYFTEKYKTPWGNAINFDDAYSYGVRNYLIENALYWFQECHIDGLRLDASDNFFDFGAKHFLRELAEVTEQFSQRQGRKFYLTAESDLNDPRWVRPIAAGGFGLDAQWNDDFHHAVHALVTRESFGYYGDYGRPEHLAKGYAKNFVYTWDYSELRQRHHGSDPSDCPSSKFVVFCQNHDQVGNRLKGDRLSHLVSFEAQKLAAASVLLSASVPLLFMGEEYGETSPFLYFVSHNDPDLVAAVRKGRKEEFAAFHAEGEADDPQSEETFERSKLNWNLHQQGQHQMLWRFYQALLKLRKQVPALANLDRHTLEALVSEEDHLIKLRRWCGNSQVLCLLNFNTQEVETTLTLPPGLWKKLLDSTDTLWGGSGSELPEMIPTQRGIVSQQILKLQPQSVVIYEQG